MKRAQRIEWEHVVPAHAFGQSFKEWREGHPDCVTQSGKAYKGRKCASKVNIEYRRMEADMHNLFPAIGEVNGDRSNYSMAILPGEPRLYGKCDVEISSRKIEPGLRFVVILRGHTFTWKAATRVETLSLKMQTV